MYCSSLSNNSVTIDRCLGIKTPLPMTDHGRCIRTVLLDQRGIFFNNDRDNVVLFETNTENMHQTLIR